MIRAGELTMDQDTHDVLRRRRVDRSQPHRVQAAALPHAQPRTAVLSKAQILDHVWEYDFNGDAGIVESYISYLRRKIDPHSTEAADPDQARLRLHAQGRQDRLTPDREEPCAAKFDAVTRWWRGKSLRAKVTGVTAALLAIGLVAAGIGTMLFLRNALLANLDAQLESLAPTDLAAGPDREARSSAPRCASR